MKQEEKDLLLRDLCARLLYGVEIICEASKISLTLSAHMLGEIIKDGNELQWKPYLRSMSTMTKDEREEYFLLSHRDIDRDDNDILIEEASELLDWLNKNMFDYRGLIPMGLALERKN